MIRSDNLSGTPGKRLQLRAFCSAVRFLLIPLVLLSCPAQAAEVVSHPYKGITYISRSESSPRPVNMHIVLIDLTAEGISFKLTPPGGRRETLRETTLDFLNRQNARVAINCHFFVPFPSSDVNSNVVGLAASREG